MVSTIGLAPGQAPSCVSCGRAFPVPAAPQAYSTGSSSAAGAGVLLSVLVFIAIGVFLLMSFRRQSSVGREVHAALAAAQQDADLEALIVQLESDDYNRAIDAWHRIYVHDRRDHWGTFGRLEAAYGRTRARNCLWILTGGFCEFYDERGEKAVARELVARRADRENFDLVCECLEQFPAQITRERGADAGLAFVAKSARILEAAQPQVDDAQSLRRLKSTLVRLRSQLPAERR